MEGPHGPQTQVREGAYAIKVSMRCSNGLGSHYKLDRVAHGPGDFRAGFYDHQEVPESVIRLEHTLVWLHAKPS